MNPDLIDAERVRGWRDGWRGAEPQPPADGEAAAAYLIGWDQGRQRSSQNSDAQGSSSPKGLGVVVG